MRMRGERKLNEVKMLVMEYLIDNILVMVVTICFYAS